MFWKDCGSPSSMDSKKLGVKITFPWRKFFESKEGCSSPFFPFHTFRFVDEHPFSYPTIKSNEYNYPKHWFKDAKQNFFEFQRKLFGDWSWKNIFRFFFFNPHFSQTKKFLLFFSLFSKQFFFINFKGRVAKWPLLSGHKPELTYYGWSFFLNVWIFPCLFPAKKRLFFEKGFF